MRGAVAALGLVLAGWPLAASAQTVINPDVGPTRGLGTTVGQAGTVFTVDGGTRAGNNLFHSFDRFSVGVGDTARWVRGAGDGGSIANVVNRVTGGQVSAISGTLDSTALPNAAFWFINPAGIVFGAGAVVNVPSAAHFSTASELRFADGGRFAVAAPDGSTLSVAAPEAFGFIGGEGAIAIRGVDDGFSSDRFTLGFTATSLEVSDSTIFARGLDLIGVGDGPAVVQASNPLAAAHAGLIQLFNSELIVVGTDVGGGSLRVSGGEVVLETTALASDGNIFVNASDSVFADFSSFDVFSVTRAAAGAIEIRSPVVGMANTAIFADAIAEGAPGRIMIETGDLFLLSMEIKADAKDGVGAMPGLISLRSTGDFTLLSSEIRSNANGAADGGQVLLEGRDVEISDSRVQSDTAFPATGSAGVVGVKAESLMMGVNARITSTTNSDGDGGLVLIDAGALRMDLQSAIRSDTRGAGSAGGVIVAAGTIDMDGASITSRAAADVGDAGAVLIEVGRLTMIDSTISSGTTTRGVGGQVLITADDIVLEGNRRKFTSISSDTLGDGDAGDVEVRAKTVVVRNGGYVSSDTFGGDGAAGDVMVVVDELRVENGGYISSDAFGNGAAGRVSINAGNLAVVGGDFDITYISSDSLSAGDAGSVEVDAGSILVDNAGFISSDTYTAGQAGDVTITADTIDLKNFGNIRTRTLEGSGDAGVVTIVAKSLAMQTGGAISSEAEALSTGSAGGIDITVDTLTVGNDALITTSTSSSGSAGAIAIQGRIVTIDGGVVSSSAEPGATGAALLLGIKADSLSVVNGGAVSTLSTNPNPAGLIVIAAGELRVDGRGSIISSENQSGNPNFGGLGPGPGGDAGQVVIVADDVTIANGGRISTNSFAGAAGDIEIGIERPGLFTLEGKDAPGVIQTSSGPGTGGRITITDPLAIISNGGSILALGQQQGANVRIESRYFINSTDRRNIVSVDGDFELQTGLYDVSSGTVSRELSVLDASKVLRGQCPAARSTGAVSQLITRPVGPYAREGAVDVLERPAGAASSPVGACP